MQEIIAQAKSNYQNKKPFVLFANPNSNVLNAYFQTEDTLYPFHGQDGFVFVAFDSNQKFIIPKEKSTVCRSEIQEYESNLALFESTPYNLNEKANFEELVAKAIQNIKENHFSKVVVSRKVSIPVQVDFIASYLSILKTYVSAFRYLFFHPKIGMWMGASPEQLVQINGDKLQTVALAGTQLYKEDIIWEAKEKQEQQFVTDYIVSKIQSCVTKTKVSQPFTAKAGNLAHIKTIIDATLMTDQKALETVQVLHPTPAVCGLPKESALSFILANENYDRKFYSGFLGEWNEDKKKLFVNLRCAEIEEELVHFYVGCGITNESVPEKEFFETENKLGIMQRIIKLKVKS
ncbi:isochorismate synthase [Flavobacterium sp. J27]|uniref:isochorismate synthase n=1 Tax=Flavobacterium sp. J27 TaxID=2060419 RepID=UPI0010300AC9|nr:isochorismate synthase [Flavobacterium sp. J27]